MQIYGQSRYFVSTYKAPIVDTRYQAYPIDVCVNFEITLSGITPKEQFGVFSCNAAGNIVTFTDYGTDSSCSGNPTGTTNYSSDVIAGDRNSFNCQGEDNYVTTDGCTVNKGKKGNCCSSGCLDSSSATNVCVNNNDGTYSMYVYVLYAFSSIH